VKGSVAPPCLPKRVAFYVSGVCDAEVSPGDRIVAVNGFAGVVEDMLATIAASETPELLISRCPDG